MTTSHEGHGPTIPDFDKDAQSLAAYDEAKVRFERREASDAESKTRAFFNRKRDAIRAEIAVAASLLEERRIKAQKALNAFAARYPHRIDRNKPQKPSFWESLLSFGMAGRLYKKTQSTAADAASAQTLRRRKEHDEEELEQQLKRSLYLQDDSIKKRLESPEGMSAFHARPGVAVLHKRVEEIKAERAEYAARLERGDVKPDEQREREFAERKIAQLEVPFSGMLIARVVRYGHLSYFVLRDLEKKLYHLSYDPRLDGLAECVFDVFRLADTFEAKLHRNPDGRPFTPLDHFAVNFRDEEIARTEYRKQRTAMRAPRADIPPMTFTDAAEQQLLDLLAGMAKTVGPLNGIVAPAPAGMLGAQPIPVTPDTPPSS